MEVTQRERAEAVQRMQDYIERHLDEPILLQQLAQAAGYSPFHATRLFRELVGIAPSDYLRARRLSQAALRLRDTEDAVFEVALDASFESQEGFTRAFSRQFGTTPAQYRKEAPPLSLYMPRSARFTYLHSNPGGISMKTESVPQAVFVTLEDRPPRKLILQRGNKATEYWGYCEEMGCDVWGELQSLKGALHEPMGMWLPESLRAPGTSEYVMGVEMPLDYTGPVPEGMEVIDLPANHYLVFQGQPYPDEEMGQAIGAVWRAIEIYQPEPTGWCWDESMPRFQYAPMGERGYIEGRPVKRR